MKLIYLLIAFTSENPSISDKPDFLAHVFDTYEECEESKNEIEEMLTKTGFPLVYTCHPVVFMESN